MKEGKFIAGGSEKRVYEHPTDPEKIVKTYKTENEDFERVNSNKVRARYYLGKLLHILYPKNFPDINLSSSKPNQVVMERKNLDPEHLEIFKIENKAKEAGRSLAKGEDDQIYSILEARRHDPSIAELKMRMTEMGIDLDHGGINYAYDEVRNVIFVDNVHPWDYTYDEDEEPVHPNFDVKKLTDAIALLESEEERKVAATYLKRLEALFIEEKKRLEEKK